MIKNLINGQWLESADRFETRNPATGALIDTVCQADARLVDRAVQAAKQAFPVWAGMTNTKRAALVEKLADLIDAHVPAIAAKETEDTGLPIAQTSTALIPRASANFRFFADRSRHMDGHTYPVDDQMLNYTILQPVGVCALITPWNIPFMAATWKVAPAIALGNTCVLKPAELSPVSAAILGELVMEAGIPPGVVNICQGAGEITGDALVRHPDVRVISFTGETVTGETIIRNGGIKKYSMEMGGKSPVLVFDDSDWERALDATLFTIFSLNGERCTAGSRVFVQDTIYDRFAQQFAARAERIKVGDPSLSDTQVGALICAEHRDKVQGYIELGRREGARLAAGGCAPDDLAPHLDRRSFLRPTVLADVRNDMRVAQEEIFGPVVCLIPFHDDGEALQLANDVKYGLAAYIWTGDLTRAHRLARAVESGMVFVNSQNVRDLRQPFGGVKASGIGREGGDFSFEVYTEVKNVCISLGAHAIPRWGAGA
jgi:5-carboxymethyl-2-hydroxymuconic-semialdehyde dehydrogenase